MPFRCKECCVVESGSTIARAENKMRFEIVNKQRRKVRVCKIDGCLIQGDNKRCDYLFLLPNQAFLVELKGIDRNHALMQIIESAETLGSRSFNGQVHAYIVTSRVPRADTKFQSNIAKLRKRYIAAKCRLPVQKNIQISIEI